MSTRIESTVEDLPAVLAKSGVSGKQHVSVTVYDDDETAKIIELRRLIDEGLEGDYIDGEEVFAELRRNLVQKHPELKDATVKV